MNYFVKRLLSLSVTLAVLSQLLLISPMGNAYATTQDISSEIDQTQMTDETALLDNPLNAQSKTAEPPLTHINNIVIFTRFQGVDEYITETRMQNVQANFNTGANSLKQYISTMSYGDLTVESSFFPKDTQGNVISYQLPHPKDYYLEMDPSNPLLGISRYEKDINAMLIDPIVKNQIETALSKEELDTNGDNLIDSIMIVSSGFQGTWGDTLWPEFSGQILFDSPNTLHSTSGYFKIQLCEPNVIGNLSRTIIHEFCHRLGLPDLYRDTKKNPGTPVNFYDIMAEEENNFLSNLLQYQQRNVLGWGTPIDEFTSGGQFTLKLPEYQNKEVDGGGNNTPETAIILKSPYSSKEFFVVEYRGHQAFDANQCYSVNGQKTYFWESGLLIYRIASNSKGNRIKPDQIYVFRPGETKRNEADGDINKATMSFSSGRTSVGKDFHDEVDGFDNEVLYFTNGQNSGIEIHLIENEHSTNEDTITFQVDFHSKGTGTSDNPYLITSLGDFELINKNSSSSFKLLKDIDASGFDYFTFQPATLSGGGVFDGNNHKIYNLNYNGNVMPTGLFSTILPDAQVKNLTLENFNVTAFQAQCGALVGKNYGLLENINIIGGNVNANTSDAGGIAGYSTGELRNCFSSIQVHGSRAGGLVGWNYYSGQIYDSVAVGTITGYNSTSLIGGIIGENTIYNDDVTSYCENCYWVSSLSGQTVGAMGQSYVDGKTPTDGMQEIIMTIPVITSDIPIALPTVQLEQGTVINGTWSIKNPLFAPIKITNNQICGLYNTNGILCFTFYVNEHPFTIDIPISVSGITEPQFIFTAQLDSLVAIFNGIAARIYETGNHKVYLYDGTTVTPLRVVSECAGLIVDYDDTTGNTIVTNPHTGEYIIIKLGDTSLKKYSSDGTVLGSLTMAVAPMVVGDRTYVPMRAVSEAFGYQVYYREHTDGYNYVTLTNRNPAFTDDEIIALCDDAARKIAAY